jgi:hypothetical protein
MKTNYKYFAHFNFFATLALGGSFGWMMLSVTGSALTSSNKIS